METTTMGYVGIMGYRLKLGLECWAFRYSRLGEMVARPATVVESHDAIQNFVLT